MKTRALLLAFGLFLGACTAAQRASVPLAPATGPPGSPSPTEPIARPAPAAPDRWDAYRKSGVDFVATGNEPFWSLTMDNRGQMRFRTAAGPDSLTAPVPAPSQAQDAPVVRYRAATAAGELVVTVAQRPCTNDMSGEALPYTVSVRATTTARPQAQEYAGCGRYLGDYRLHDIWALESVDGQAVVAAQFPKDRPYVELNLVRQQVLGFAGCNRFSGPLTPERAGLRFGPLRGTRLSCPALAFEQQLLQLLAERAFTYRIENRRLTLTNRANSLVFRKVD